MRGLAGIVGATLGGSVGWWLGSYVGLLTAVVVSAAGSGVGLYYGRRLIDDTLP